MNTKWIVRGGLAAVFAMGIAYASTSAAENTLRPPWVDSSGRVDTSKMPARIKVGTGLFPAGFGWLDSAALREKDNPGPFNVYESETAKSPAYWYYVDSGVVPIGTPLEQSDKPLTTVSIADTEGAQSPDTTVAVP